MNLISILLFLSCVACVPPNSQTEKSIHSQLVTCQIQKQALTLEYQYALNAHKLLIMEEQDTNKAMSEYIASLEATVNFQTQIIRHLSTREE